MMELKTNREVEIRPLIDARRKAKKRFERRIARRKKAKHTQIEWFKGLEQTLNGSSIFILIILDDFDIKKAEAETLNGDGEVEPKRKGSERSI